MRSYYLMQQGFHKTLFTRWDEVESSWKLIDLIKEKEPKPIIYSNYEELKTIIKEKMGVDMS